MRYAPGGSDSDGLVRRDSMKRNVVCLLLCLLLVLPLPVAAADYQDVQYVVDQADILTDAETMELDNIARKYSSHYGMDVLIALVSDMDGVYADDYAVALNSADGWWDTDNAILFLLAMEERVWYIATFGEAMDLFSDDSLDMLGESAVSGFFAGYYEGFCSYLELLYSYLEAGLNDEPIEKSGYYSGIQQDTLRYNYGRTFRNILPSSLLTGVIVASISLLIMRAGMNTKRKQRSAGEYLNQGSFRLRVHRDIFLYSNVSKVRRQQNSGSGGTGTVHRSSSGRSHGGRGGKF